MFAFSESSEYWTSSQKIVTPVKTGVQVACNYMKALDSGACPGHDPGFAGMTRKWAF
jgi:hypothetical protein